MQNNKEQSVKQCNITMERMEDRISNLNLYISYIERNYPEVYEDMIENLSGLPGYSRTEALNG